MVRRKTMINKMLFSALILLINLIVFACQSPADIEQSEKSETRLSENLEVAEETIVADEIVADSNIITEKPEAVEGIAEAGKPDTVAEHDSPAVIPINYYTIQVGAYWNINYANEMLEKLKAMNLSAYIERENDFSKVRIAGIRTKEEVVSIINKISDKYNLNPILLKN
jgi:cell division septation protein DedD